MTLARWLFQVLADEKVIDVVERGEPNNANHNRSHGRKRFAAHADEKLTAFVELESVIHYCGELPRQVGDIFPKLTGYESKHSNSSSCVFTRLLCAFA